MTPLAALKSALPSSVSQITPATRSPSLYSCTAGELKKNSTPSAATASQTARAASLWAPSKWL